MFSILELIPQLLKVSYYVLNALILSPFASFVLYTDAANIAITFLISFQALSGPICLLVTRFVHSDIEEIGKPTF